MSIVARLQDMLAELRRNSGGAITVEMAFVLPIFISLALLSWDAATIYTQIKRGTKHYYSIGDIMASQTDDMTCARLDKVAELVYSSYAAGNWARRPRTTGDDFNEDGALDFRFIVRVVTVQDPATETVTGDLKGRVRWVYFRTPEDMDSASEKKPGELVEIPDGLRIPGQTYAQIKGRLWVAPAINYLGIFDFDPANSSVTHMQIDIDRIFPLRFITSLGLDHDLADPLSDKCSDGSNYPA